MSDIVNPNNTPLVKLDCDAAFQGLNKKEKLYAHYLSRACWYGGLIVLFQTSPESPLIYILLDKLFRSQNLESLKKTALEECGFDEEDFKALLVYAACFYSNTGNYRGFGDNKFIPGLPKEKLHSLVKSSVAFKKEKEAIEYLWNNCGEALYSVQDNEKHLGLPPKGITTYFSKNCDQKDADIIREFLKSKSVDSYNLRSFKATNSEAGDNSKYEIRFASSLSTDTSEDSVILGKEIFKNNTFNFTRGDYAELLKLVDQNLTKAQQYAANVNEGKMLENYILSFTTGSLQAHKDGSRFWIKDKGPAVETYIGFIETYRDPDGMRGEFEGFVAVVNKSMSEKFASLVSKAESLLTLLPWPTSFEKDKFLKPDFTSLDVLSFSGSGIPAGINIPNYDEIRQNEGFKNVSLGNVINAGDSKDPVNFLTPADQELFQKYRNASFEVQVGLHELLGHGSGKLFVKNNDGTFNFDIENTINPETNQKISSWYNEGETYDSKFGSLGSSYEECRAECVGLYLCVEDEVLKVFGFFGDEAHDISYVNWLDMVQKGIEALKTYSPETKSWLQSHSQARFVIANVLIEAGGGFVNIKEVTGEDGNPDLLVTLEREFITSVGKPAIKAFLQKLQVYKSTGDITSATAMYEKYSKVSDDGAFPFLRYRDIVMARKKPRRVFVQANTVAVGDDVQFKNYDATLEGMIQSWMDRFSEDSEIINRILLDAWKKDLHYFSS